MHMTFYGCKRVLDSEAAGAVPAGETAMEQTARKLNVDSRIIYMLYD